MINLTTRKSETKYVQDQKGHDVLFKRYLAILNKLIKKYPVEEDFEFKDLVNFKRNKDVPIHRWFDYKQGYAEELVRKLLSLSTVKKDAYVLDPFNGVGTTQVVAQTLGLKSIGIDINPVATFTAKVKTHLYSSAELKEIQTILFSVKKRYKITNHVPKYQRLEVIFTPHQLEQVLNIKGFWESIKPSPVRDFFKLAYLSIIEDCSNRIKDGNGIKIANKKKRVVDVFAFFETKCAAMLNDVSKDSRFGEAIVLQGSLLQDSIFDQIKGKQIGVIIFSPPYANCFDYCEVYKMEIWLGDFVKDYSDFLKYRELAVRSHVNSKFNHNIHNQNAFVNTIASLIGTYNVWNRHIPDMIRGYFDDMHDILERLYKISQKGIFCSIVVANSGYKGIIVPTDLLLAAIANHVGFKVEKIILARSIRASSQQMQELKSKSDLMRESIIILRK
jgi:hypothetical protein